MTLLHLVIDEDGQASFTAEGSSPGRDGLAPLPADELLEAVRSVVWYPSDVELRETPPAPLRAIPSMPNLMMFLSDVRDRAFKKGVFLAPDVLAAAETFRRVAADAAAGFFLPDVEELPGGAFRASWRPLRESTPFETRLMDAFVRRAGKSVLEIEKPDTRHPTVDDAWMAALRSDAGRVRWEDADDLRDLAQRLDVWRSPLRTSKADRAALSFTLVPPASEDGEWAVSLARTPRTRLGLVSLGQAAALYPPLRAMKDRSAPISRAEAANFISVGASALIAAGYSVQIPDGVAGEHLSASIDLAPKSDTAPDAAAAQGSAVSARLSVRIDGELATEEELLFILDQGSPLVFFRDRWIEVDCQAIRDALRAMRSAKAKKLTMREAVRFATGTARLGGMRVEDVRAHGWLRGLLNELRGDERFAILPPPKGLDGELRDYQRRGYSWIAFLAKWGFGPCLADDMGLGKTIQTISYLLHRKETSPAPVAPALVVAPVSVTTNWIRELRKFAPGLSAILHQGATRGVGHSLRQACRAADVVVTGYSLVVKDWDELSHVGFGALVLDEAQKVKNPDTLVSRAVRALDVPVKIALSGTPLENSASDLWAIEEVLNPGLLGSRASFNEEYSRPIRDDARTAAVAKLKRALEPFMLRRLKTDPGIASELGAKREMREYCRLSPAQRAQYESALATYREDMAAATSPAAKRGRSLALLTELKLVCDGDGKFARLDELLSEIFATGESCLVFTQYAKVGQAIRSHLLETFGAEFPFLHGSLSPARREAEIRAFNESPEPNAFILSLKAGGYGLNLTRATHVIHFDRWWNPAVENQATDRAHRIGQTKTVLVHLFICAGTLEDRIDALLETKRLIAGEIVGSGESFLLKMAGEEFDRIVELDR